MRVDVIYVFRLVGCLLLNMGGVFQTTGLLVHYYRMHILLSSATLMHMSPYAYKSAISWRSPHVIAHNTFAHRYLCVSWKFVPEI